MDLATALDFARTHRRCVLVTLRADGRPQSSNVFQWTAEDGVVRVSLTDDRAKTRNLRRDPRVSAHVVAEDFWSYVVLEGESSLTPVAQDPHDATVEGLVAYYRGSVGEHPDWDRYRAAMVADRRLLLELRPTRAYGLIRRSAGAAPPRGGAERRPPGQPPRGGSAGHPSSTVAG